MKLQEKLESKIKEREKIIQAHVYEYKFNPISDSDYIYKLGVVSDQIRVLEKKIFEETK